MLTARPPDIDGAIMCAMWRLMLVLSAGSVLAGCAQQAPPPSPNAVEVNTVCAGAKQAYWQGSWWIGFPDARQRLAGDGAVREITGTMTATGPGRARLDSPALTSPQPMADTPDTRRTVPPLPCGLNAPA